MVREYEPTPVLHVVAVNLNRYQGKFSVIHMLILIDTEAEIVITTIEMSPTDSRAKTIGREPQAT